MRVGILLNVLRAKVTFSRVAVRVRNLNGTAEPRASAPKVASARFSITTGRALWLCFLWAYASKRLRAAMELSADNLFGGGAR